MKQPHASSLPVLLVLALTAPAAAQKVRPGAAQAELTKAKAHFDLQEYDLAEQALKEAYRLEPKPETLYAIAQAQRLAGACDRAIITYKNFLRTKPKAEQAAQASDNITRCEALIADAAKPPPPVEPTPAEVPPPPVAPAPAPAPAAPRPTPTTTGVPWTRNWAGHAALAGGLVLAVGGTALALGGDGAIADLNAAAFYDDFAARQADLDAARSRRTLGVVAAGAGGALVVTAALLYVLRSPSERSPTQVAIDPRGGLLLAWEY